MFGQAGQFALPPMLVISCSRLTTFNDVARLANRSNEVVPASAPTEVSSTKGLVMTTPSTPTVVLVHGAFADASGFAAVTRELQSAGLTVRAPANPLRGIAHDADAVGRYISQIEGPVVLVGHSYGGAVITQVSGMSDKVAGLVYLAGFGLDVGESIGGIQSGFTPPLLAQTAVASTYDALDAPGGPDLFVGIERFRETFCADLPVDVAAAMAVAQRPVAAASLGENCTAAGWHTIPSWYMVSEQDNAINPEVEAYMGKRMGATVKSINASHVAFMSRPVETADFIRLAVA